MAVVLLAAGTVRADFGWDGSFKNDFSSQFSWIGDPPGGDGAEPGDTIMLADNCNDLYFDTRLNIQDFVDVDLKLNNVGTIRFCNTDIPGLCEGLGNEVREYEFISVGGSFTFADGGGIVNDSTLTQHIGVSLTGTGDTLLLMTSGGGGDLNITAEINLTEGVTLVVGGGGNTTISNDGIESNGAGTLLMQGSGNLTLETSNELAGTELASGTIVLGHNAALGSGILFVTGAANLESDADSRAIANTVMLGASLTVSGGNKLALDGSLLGEGGLVLDMAAGAALTLRGNNAYSGGTTLKQGTLVVGGDNALGTGDIAVTGNSGLATTAARTIAKPIALNAQLTTSGDHDLTLAGDLTGGGSLRMNFGAGDVELALFGDNTYTGGTTLNRGTLVLAGDNAVGTGGFSITGDSMIRSTATRTIANDFDIDPGATVTFAGDSSLDLTGTISGLAGNVTVDLDPGVYFSLTGEHSYSGTTEVDGGELRLDGASLLSSVIVNDGATVTGNATIDNDLTLNSGATFRAVIDSETDAASFLDLTGTATLNAGSVVEASVSGDGYIRSGETFTIIDADGGLTDNGADFDDASATLTISLVPDVTANRWDVELIRAMDAYSNAADTGNNTSIGLALDSLIPVADADPDGDAADLLGALDAFTDPDYNRAVSELSPEPHNATGAIMRAATGEFTRLQADYLSGLRTLGRAPASAQLGPAPGSLALSHEDPLILAAAIAQAKETRVPPPGRPYEWESRWGGYAEAQGVFLDQDTTTNRTGFQSNAGGAQVGLDYRLADGLLVGVAGSFLISDADLDGNLGEIDQDMYRVGPYLSWYEGPWYVDASLSFGFTSIDSRRNIPALGLTATADYDAWDVTGYAGTGYRFRLADHLYLAPVASVIYSFVDYEEFTESGAGGANLTVPGRDDETLRTRLGANLSYRFAEVGWEPVVYGYAGWEYEALDDDDLEASFAPGSNPFIVDVGSRDRNAFFGGLGFDAKVYERAAAYFRVEVVGAEDGTGVGIAGGLRWAF